MRALLTLLAATFATSAVHAQSAAHLNGRFETDPATGLLRGDVCLSKLPQQQAYSFLLNRGLNIREVRDAASRRPLEYTGFYDATNVGDATHYTIEGGVAVGGFCVSYVGAYPVYRLDAGARSELDWKGQVAFDGRTVRAADQTRFYPVAVDAATGAPLDAVTYRLEVDCAGCKAIYVNGSPPQAGPKATFSSATPRSQAAEWRRRERWPVAADLEARRRAMEDLPRHDAGCSGRRGAAAPAGTERAGTRQARQLAAVFARAGDQRSGEFRD